MRTDPKDSGLAVRGEGAAAAYDEFEWRDSFDGLFDGVRECGDSIDGDVPEEFQREMKVVFAAPTRAHVGKFSAKVGDVLSQEPAKVARQFDGNESAKGFSHSGMI